MFHIAFSIFDYKKICHCFGNNTKSKHQARLSRLGLAVAFTPDKNKEKPLKRTSEKTRISKYSWTLSFMLKMVLGFSAHVKIGQ